MDIYFFLLSLMFIACFLISHIMASILYLFHYNYNTTIKSLFCNWKQKRKLYYIYNTQSILQIDRMINDRKKKYD